MLRYFAANIKTFLSYSTGRAQRQSFSTPVTYQEAHKVQCEDRGNPSEGQPLQYSTADPGRVAVVFGSVVVTVGLTRTGQVPKNPHRHNQMFHYNHCNILMKNLRTRKARQDQFILIIITNRTNISGLGMTRKNSYI